MTPRQLYFKAATLVTRLYCLIVGHDMQKGPLGNVYGHPLFDVRPYQKIYRYDRCRRRCGHLERHYEATMPDDNGRTSP